MNRFLVLKYEDIAKYAKETAIPVLDCVCDSVREGRAKDGKKDNLYLIVNTDEPYAGKVADMIEAHEREKGTWDHGEQSLREFAGIETVPFDSNSDNDKITINWREELIGLFPDETERTLGKGEIGCPQCNGLGLIRKGNYMVGCSVCFCKGVIRELCECGKKIDYRGYDKCSDCRHKEFLQREAKKDRERFEVARKISFADYDGRFIWNERGIDKEELKEVLWDAMLEDAPPIWIWGTKKEKVFSKIDLYDVVSDKCEDGYEEMISYFDFKDPLIIMSGELLDQWIEKHDQHTDIYTEDYGTAVLLDDLIEELRTEHEAERKCRVCGCTQDHACPGGCYWVEYDLCSKCENKLNA